MLDNTIFVCGDSHVNIFCKDSLMPDLYPEFHINNNFHVIRLGAPIAYNLIKYNTMYKARERLENILETEEIEKIILVFGEIDCRFHILNQFKKNGCTLDSIIKNCVNRYISGILEIFENYKNIKIIVYGPVASTWIDESKSNKDMPIKGSEFERNKITQKFTDYLELMCNYYDIVFISIFYQLVNGNYKTKQEYYKEDGIHLGKEAYPLIEREIVRKGLLNEINENI